MGSSQSSTPAAEEFVKKTIESNGITVFSKTWCPYCDQAKQVLNSVGAKYTVIELDNRPDGDSILAALTALTGRSTVPNVFVKTTTIGGGSDVSLLHKQGKLVQMLKEAGVLE